MFRTGVNTVAAIMLLFGSQSCLADMMAPLPARNTYPPMLRFFDPLPESAMRPYSQDFTLEFNQHYSSQFFYDSLPNGKLLVDMELYSVDLVLRRSIREDLELTLRLPAHFAYGGFLDGPIQNFHNFTGLPNGGREKRPQNQFAYRYNNGAGSWSDNGGWKIGNIVLSSRIRIYQNRDNALAGLLAVKLPTASGAQGWGSGAADYGAGMVWSRAAGAWFTHLDGWAIYPAAKDTPDMNYGAYFRGAAVVGWRYNEKYTLIGQIQGGTSPYRSNVARLDDGPLLLTFGLRGQTEGGTEWSLSFVEDLTYYTTQDFSLVLGLSWD